MYRLRIKTSLDDLNDRECEAVAFHGSVLSFPHGKFKVTRTSLDRMQVANIINND